MEHHIWAAVLGLTGLLAIAVLLMPPANRTSIPYTVLLAIFGCVLGTIVHSVEDLDALGVFGDFLSALQGFELTSEVVFFVFLPVLVFEAALSIDVRRLMEDIAPILFLAIVGLLISTFFIGYVLHWSTGMALIACLLLGAIVSATDPVAVVAIFKEVGAPKRLAILVEGESLFNDATAIVMFVILSKMLTGEADASLIGGALGFLQTFVGGVAVGYLLARALCALLARLREVELMEIALTISLAYLSFIFAEHYLHVSGVMAVVSSAVVMGSRGRTIISPQAWHAVHETWEQLGFWANSLIFVLVGMAVPGLLADFDGGTLLALAVLLIAGFAVRAAVVYGLVPALSSAGFAHPVSSGYRTVMWWGGLRGAVSLGLAFIILEDASIDAEIRSFVGTLVTGFVLFTLFVNATTVRVVLKSLGLNELSPADQAVRDRALSVSLSSIGHNLQEAAEHLHADRGIAHDIAEEYRQRCQEALAKVEALGDRIDSHDWQRIGLATLVAQERQSFLDQFAGGFLSSDVFRLLLARADDLSDALKTGGVEGYEAAAQKALGFDWSFQLARWLQSRFGYERMLGRRLAERFEMLIGARAALQRERERGLARVEELVGPVVAVKLRENLDARLEATEQALRALELQYPDYASGLQRRHLERGALRLEAADYDRMRSDALISGEVYSALEQGLAERKAKLEHAPRLDLGLEPAKLVACVPLFAGLPSERIAKIAALLEPRLAVPGERVVTKGERGDAMYFVSTGAVEVQLDAGPVELGTGDFFGEIALVTEGPRVADVVARCYCDLLALPRRSFTQLLGQDDELRDTIERVAQERLSGS